MRTKGRDYDQNYARLSEAQQRRVDDFELAASEYNDRPLADFKNARERLSAAILVADKPKPEGMTERQSEICRDISTLLHDVLGLCEKQYSTEWSGVRRCMMLAIERLIELSANVQGSESGVG